MLTDKKIWTACVTPMHVDGEVDYSSMEKIIKMQVEAGNGVLVLGSTGEANTLTDCERRSLISLATKFTNHIMIGLPSFATAEYLYDFIAFCNDFDIAGYLAPVPPYSKPGVYGQIEWFRRILNLSQKDVMLYNIPGRSAAPLHIEVVEALYDEKNFAAIKDSTGNCDFIQQCNELQRRMKTRHKSDALNSDRAKDLEIYCGDDGLLRKMSEYGASGLVSVASNIWPVALSKHVALCLAQNEEKNEDAMLDENFEELFKASNPLPAKKFLAHTKCIDSDKVRTPLNAADLLSCDDIIALNERILQWMC